MRSISRGIARLVAGAVLGITMGIAPASAAVSFAQSCVLLPGVYGIMDSSGTVVAILIVYPDCRTEIFKKQEPA